MTTTFALLLRGYRQWVSSQANRGPAMDFGHLPREEITDGGLKLSLQTRAPGPTRLFFADQHSAPIEIIAAFV